MLLFALPQGGITLILVAYYAIILYLSRKLYFIWQSNKITSTEYLVYILVGWLIPVVGLGTLFTVTRKHS